MIAAIKIRNYKGIKRTPWVELDSFQVLVGPNGSGKTTFLEAIEFIKLCLVNGPRSAVEKFAPDYRDLTFRREGGPMEFDLRLRFSDTKEHLDELHYRFALNSDEELGVRISEEVLERISAETESRAGARLLGKTRSGNDYYQRESGPTQDTFQFGPGKLALSLIPPDIQKYPTGNLAKNFLAQSVRYIQLNSAAMRQPVAATRPTELELDGTNLARVVGSLLKNGGHRTADGREAIERWTEHLRYALENLESIRWAAREPDNAEYLILKFAGGLECPSWLLSDGTLRMLALTLPAFLSAPPSLYMVEEPENGVHPYALEIIVKALAAIPHAQVFVATHSPMVVQQVGAKPLVCFTRDEHKGIQIIHGPDHPALRNWDGNPDLASIFSSRVLG